ncbi:MAG TPA: DUF2231 domain-containing protein [Candidatus Binataceae bacterium]|nr:DUF2231 domain-containing protein [Candidatus Binataceae bacterium]
MDRVLDQLQKMQLHPVADHFTVALLIVGVLIDLASNLAPSRAWIRYMALTLMILGALAAGASYWTGDRETDRIWDALGPQAREVLKWHARLGFYLAITFGVLALWRILVESFGFMAATRGFYQAIAVVAIFVLSYSAHLGGQLVYDFGAGTALMAAQPIPSAEPSSSEAPTEAGPIPTVSVPTPVPSVAPSPAPKAETPAASPAASTSVAPVPAHPAPSSGSTPAAGTPAKPSGSATL